MGSNRRRIHPPVSVVTGAAPGIGAALATALHRRGGHVVVADLDGDGGVAAVARLGERASFEQVDVGDPGAVAALVERVVDRHGSLDLLANNAGIGLAGRVDETTDRHWERALAVNLAGMVHGSRAAYPVMRARGRGVILNTASLAGLVPVPGMLPYMTTKWGVVGMSLGLRAEAAHHGVRVSVLCPSFVDTPLLDNPFEPPPSITGPARDRLRRLQPRMLTAEQVAEAALRGLDADRAVIAVGALSRVAWAATRVSPQGAARLMGAVYARDTRGD
ncbi:MAG TPA: SDR family oxidoreductase [Dermatophilaceae bacterium]|nr:SDR family oxidoreductase [Dermatophilaceae bacterium]